MAYQKESKFDDVDPKATPEQMAASLKAMASKLNTEFTRLEKSVNPQGRTVTLTVKGMDDKPITLIFKNGLLS